MDYNYSCVCFLQNVFVYFLNILRMIFWLLFVWRITKNESIFSVLIFVLITNKIQKKNMFFFFVFINWHIAFKSKFSKALFLFRKHPFVAIHFVQYITEQHSTFSVLYWLLSFAHPGHCEMYHHHFLCVHFPISSDAMSLTRKLSNPNICTVSYTRNPIYSKPY